MRTYNVLFLCTANSARSILAEAILRRECNGRYKAFSAGSRPAGKVHALVLELLESDGFNTTDFRSKSWGEFATKGAPDMDFIFTVCGKAAGELCPLWPGNPMGAHWCISDPAAAQGNEAERRAAFKYAYARLGTRIAKFVNLPLDDLAEAALKRELTHIGQPEV